MATECQLDDTETLNGGKQIWKKPPGLALEEFIKVTSRILRNVDGLSIALVDVVPLDCLRTRKTGGEKWTTTNQDHLELTLLTNISKT